MSTHTPLDVPACTAWRCSDEARDIKGNVSDTLRFKQSARQRMESEIVPPRCVIALPKKCAWTSRARLTPAGHLVPVQPQERCSHRLGSSEVTYLFRSESMHVVYGARAGVGAALHHNAAPVEMVREWTGDYASTCTRSRKINK